MDRSQWIRDPGKVHKALAVQLDGSVLASRDVKVYIPSRYVEKNLAEVGAEVLTLGVFAMVVDNKHYAISLTCAKMRLKPSSITTVKFDGDSYLELHFPAGSVVIADTTLPRIDSLVYRIYNEFIEKGKIPWFMDYDDIGLLFRSALEHANVRLTDQHSIMEMFAATIARDRNQLTRYYRHSLPADPKKELTPPAWVAFRNVTYGATNTTSRLMGSYFSEGLTSALVNPSERNEPIEDMLRQ